MTKNSGLNLLRILDGKDTLPRLEYAAITDLAARFGVERRFVEHHNAVIAFLQFADRAAVLVERQNGAFEFERLVAVEGGRRAAVLERRSHLEFACGTPVLSGGSLPARNRRCRR